LGNGGIAPRIFDLGIGGQLHASAALPLGQEPSFGWASESVWTRWRRENPIVAPAGNWTLIVQSIA